MQKKEIRQCEKHGLVNHAYEACNDYWRCMKCRCEAVQRRRDKLKLLAIEYKGGKCERCGYNKCPDALDFHHKDKSQKDFGISKNGVTRAWEKVKKELDKCALLCANCHREEHSKHCILA